MCPNRAFCGPSMLLGERNPGVFFVVVSKSRKFAKEQKRHRIPFHSFHVDAGISASMGGRPEFRPRRRTMALNHHLCRQIGVVDEKSLDSAPNQNQHKHRLAIIAGVSQKETRDFVTFEPQAIFEVRVLFFLPYCLACTI